VLLWLHTSDVQVPCHNILSDYKFSFYKTAACFMLLSDLRISVPVFLGILFHVYGQILWHVTPCRNRVSTVPCQREPTKAEESRSEPSQQKGRMFILCCSATVGYTCYAISTTIATVFGGVRSEELSWKPSPIQNQFVRSSPTSQLLSNSLKKWIRGVSSRRELRSVKM
jgi:hypothetical protein